MAYKGLFSSDGSMAGDRKVGFASAMVELNTVSNAPLLTIMGAKTTRNYRSTSVEWVEKTAMTGVNYIVGNNGDATGCVLRFADTSWITENMIFLVVATGEFLFVTGVSGQVVHVTRGYGSSMIQPIVPTDLSDVVVQRVGTAFHEGSERPDAVSMTQGTPKFQFTQIFRNTWALTRTAKMVSYNLGDMKMRVKKDALMFHTHDIERAILFGIRSSGVQNNQPIRSFDGLYRQITTNIASPAGGILTKTMLDTFFEVIFSHTIDGAPNRRIVICGRQALTFINRLAEMNTHYVIGGREDTYGVNVTTWVTPHGEVTLIPHDILSNFHGRRADIIVLHPDALEVYYMYEGEEDCDTLCKTGGIDGDVGGLITEMTFTVKGELACGIMTGICDVAADPTPVQLVQPYEPPAHPGIC